MLASETIDEEAIVLGLVLPGRVSDRVAAAYERHLFGDATLQDLPGISPRFVVNATNMQSGVLWWFMKPYMRDYRVVGEAPNVRLSRAVAASSAFPPVLSAGSAASRSILVYGILGWICNCPLYTNVILSDGGVYDDLGLKIAWKRYERFR